MYEALLHFFAAYKAGRSAADREHARVNSELVSQFHTPEVRRAFSERWLHAREGGEVLATLSIQRIHPAPRLPPKLLFL